MAQGLGGRALELESVGLFRPDEGGQGSVHGMFNICFWSGSAIFSMCISVGHDAGIETPLSLKVPL